MLVDASQIEVVDWWRASFGNHRVTVCDDRIKKSEGFRLPCMADKKGGLASMLAVIQEHVCLPPARKVTSVWYDNLDRHIRRLHYLVIWVGTVVLPHGLP